MEAQDNLSAPKSKLAKVAFDTAVMAGPGKAKGISSTGRGTR